LSDLTGFSITCAHDAALVNKSKRNKRKGIFNRSDIKLLFTKTSVKLALLHGFLIVTCFE
jgi:hypothetical protein